MANANQQLIPLWSDDFTYKEHQISGIRWMIEQENDASLRGGFLCDEMGLGKTIEVLGLVKNLEVNRSLMLGPVAVLSQWQELAQKSKFNVFLVDRTRYQWQCTKKLYINRPSVYIMNYECAVGHPSLTSIFIWDRLILDEAHRLANQKSKIHITISNISAQRRWAVTATPIVNGLGDAKSLLKIVGMDVDELPLHQITMLPIIQKKALCRRVDELRQSMPELPVKETTHIHTVPFDKKEEEEFYRSIQGKLVERLNVLMEEGSDQWAILKLLMLLRQLSVHPQVYINARKRESKYYSRDDWKGDSTKFNALKDLIDSQSKTAHRWLIFCQFHDEIELLENSLSKLPRVKRIQSYSGKHTMAQRDEIIKQTKEPLDGFQNTEILLVQLQSGSVGLNLQHFDRVVFMSPWWTAALMDQAVGRAVRIGQNKKVEVHHFRLEEEQSINIDELMIEKVDAKREMCDWFLDNASRGLLNEEGKMEMEVEANEEEEEPQNPSI
jgi:SNF2 family DNA or RNA helicase